MPVLNIRDTIHMSPNFLSSLKLKELELIQLFQQIEDWIELHNHLYTIYEDLNKLTLELNQKFKNLNNHQYNSDFDKLNLDKLNQLITNHIFQYQLKFLDELISETINPMKDEISQCRNQFKYYQTDFNDTNQNYDSCISNFTGLKKITMDVVSATKLVQETQNLYTLRVNNCQKLLNRVTVVNHLCEVAENWWGKQINRYIQLSHQSITKSHHDWDNRGYQSSLVQWELNNQMVSININSEPNALTKNFQSVQFYQAQDLFRTDLAKFCKNLGLPLSDQNQALQLLNASQSHNTDEKEGYLFFTSSANDDQWKRGYFKCTPDRYFIEINDKKSDDQLISFVLASTTINEIDHLYRHNVLQLSHIGVNSVNTILIQPETSGDKKEWLRVLQRGEIGDMTSSISELQSVQDISNDPNPANSAIFGMDFSRNASLSMNGQDFDDNREVNHAAPARWSPSPTVLSQHLPQSSRQSQSSWSGSDQTVVKTGPVYYQEYKHQSKDSSGWKKMVFTLLKSGVLLQHDEASKSLVTSFDLNKLSRHAIQALDEGWFGIRGAFSIQLDDHRKLLFQANNLLERNIWVCLIKTFGQPEIFGKLTPIPKIYRLCRSFWLRIIDGRNFPPAMNQLYCQVLVNGALVAVTPTRAKHENPFWREDFMLDDLPALKDGITVSILSQNKYQKDTVVGNCSVPVQSNRSAEIYEGWYPVIRTQVKSVKKTKGAPLISSIQSPTYVGDLRMRLRYDEAVVLASNQYQPLLQLLLDLRSGLVYDVIASARDVDWVAETFLKIYCANHMTIAWLKYLADVEVAQSEDPNLLFRGNSVMTKSIETYMKMVGLQYVDETLGDVVRTICHERIIVEVDASKLERAEDVKTQWKTLICYAQKIWDCVHNSKTRCPQELRLFFSYLREITNNKFKDQPEKVMNTRYTCISGFLFLRLVCPAILSPKLFGLVREHPDPKNQRTLTLLAKSLQCLANLADFGVKEPYMTQMNEFIEKNTNHLMEFIDYIASDPLADSETTIPVVEQPYPLPPHRTGFSGPLPPYTIDLDRELSSLSRYVVRHSKYYKLMTSGNSSKKPETNGDDAPVETPTRKSKPEALEKLLTACNQIDFFTKDCIKAGTEEIIWEN